jgi:2'-5' RNA ligase
MEIRIALIPPAKISVLAARLAKKYAVQAKHRFVVDNRNLFPHNTLFKVDVKKKDYIVLLGVVKTELRKFNPLRLDIKGFLISEGGWVGLKINPSSELIKLRKKLAEAVDQSKLAKVQLKSSYHPHLTLIRFYKPDASSLIKAEPVPRTKFIVRDIGLCLSRQTQVYKILNTIKLK